MATKKTTKVTESAVTKFEESFEKLFGANTLRRGKSKKKYDVISTGIMALDAALTVGGYIEGRITQIWGPPDSGKSSTALMACAQAQKKHPGKMVGYLDVEHKFDDPWAELMGVDLARIVVFAPITAEDVADGLKEMLQSGLFSMVVVDSVGAMIAKAEQDKQAGEATVALVAKIVTRMVKHATSFSEANSVAVLILNQVRDSIGGTMSVQSLPGGWALKHASTAQIRLRALGGADNTLTISLPGQTERVVVGARVAAKVERNKVAPPGAVASYMFVNRGTSQWGPVGVDMVDEALVVGKQFGVILRAGAKYTIVPTGEIIHTEDKVKTYLRENPDAVADIRSAVLEKISGAVIDFPEDDEPEEGEDTVVELEEAAPPVDAATIVVLPPPTLAAVQPIPVYDADDDIYGEG